MRYRAGSRTVFTSRDAMPTKLSKIPDAILEDILADALIHAFQPGFREGAEVFHRGMEKMVGGGAEVAPIPAE